MDIQNYFTGEKKALSERIDSRIRIIKKQYGSRLQTDSFDKIRVFCKGGKKLRGLIFITTAKLLGYKNTDILLDIGAMLELLHAALLIHDDIMDNDELRRGKPSVYAQYSAMGRSIGAGSPVDFGKSMGICIGDMTFFIALNILPKISDTKFSSKDRIYEIILHELITVTLGQMDDITMSTTDSMPGQDQIISMYTNKTAHYTFSLPFLLAAELTNQPAVSKKQLEQIGIDMGILFQIKDDAIGLFSDEKISGKPIASDIRESKKTLLRIFLETRMNKSEKIFMNSISKTKPLSQKNIKKIMNILKIYNVKKYSDSVIKKYHARILKNIHSLNVSVELKNFLIEILNYIVMRTF